MPIGKFEFQKVPFGLAQAPLYFQQLINKVFKGLPFAFGYLDIFIFGENNEKHHKHLGTVFYRLQAADLKPKRTKCNVLKCKLHYLGHVVSWIDIYFQYQKYPRKLP